MEDEAKRLKEGLIIASLIAGVAILFHLLKRKWKVVVPQQKASSEDINPLASEPGPVKIQHPLERFFAKWAETIKFFATLAACVAALTAVIVSVTSLKQAELAMATAKWQAFSDPQIIARLDNPNVIPLNIVNFGHEPVQNVKILAGVYHVPAGEKPRLLPPGITTNQQPKSLRAQSAFPYSVTVTNPHPANIFVLFSVQGEQTFLKETRRVHVRTCFLRFGSNQFWGEPGDFLVGVNPPEYDPLRKILDKDY